MTSLAYGKVNARSDDKNSITNHWRNRTPFKGNSVTGIEGGAYMTGRLPTEWRNAYHRALDSHSVNYTIFSYGTPIAWVLSDGTEVKPPIKYSVTTSKHQGRIY